MADVSADHCNIDLVSNEKHMWLCTWVFQLYLVFRVGVTSYWSKGLASPFFPLWLCWIMRSWSCRNSEMRRTLLYERMASRGPFLVEVMETTSWTNLNMMISVDLHGVQILWWFQFYCQLPQDSNRMMVAQVSHSKSYPTGQKNPKRKLPLGHSDLVCHNVSIKKPIFIYMWHYKYVTVG